METNVPNVFLGGDALAGPWTVVGAISHGTKAARAILAKEQIKFSQEFSSRISFDEEEQSLEVSRKKAVLKPFKEQGKEACRCLECNYICDICTEVCPNRANVMIPVKGEGLKNLNQILHIDGMCNECGNCAVFCPYDGAPYRDKLPLYENEAQFLAGENAGVAVVDRVSGRMKVRVGQEIFELCFEKNSQPTGSIPSEVTQVISTMMKDYGYLVR